MFRAGFLLEIYYSCSAVTGLVTRFGEKEIREKKSILRPESYEKHLEIEPRYYVQPFTLNNSTFYSQCIYGFHIIFSRQR